MNKKIILSLGAMSTLAIPVVAVVSCSPTDENKRTTMATELAKVLNNPLIANKATFTDAGWTIKLDTIKKGGTLKLEDLEKDLSQELTKSWILDSEYSVDTIKLVAPGSEISAETTSLELNVTLKRGKTVSSVKTMLYVKDEVVPTVTIDYNTVIGGTKVDNSSDTLTLEYNSSVESTDPIKALFLASDNVYSNLAATYTLTKVVTGGDNVVLEKHEIPVDENGQLTSGSYILTAKFTDGQGNESSEATLNITINAKPAT